MGESTQTLKDIEDPCLGPRSVFFVRFGNSFAGRCVSLWTRSEVAIAVASLVHQMISRSSVAADAVILKFKHELFGGSQVNGVT